MQIRAGHTCEVTDWRSNPLKRIVEHSSAARERAGTGLARRAASALSRFAGSSGSRLALCSKGVRGSRLTDGAAGFLLLGHGGPGLLLEPRSLRKPINSEGTGTTWPPAGLAKQQSNAGRNRGVP